LALVKGTDDCGAGPKSPRIPPWSATFLLLAAGVLAGLMETKLPSIAGLLAPNWDATHLAIGLLALLVAFRGANQFWRLPWQRPSSAIALAFCGCLVAGLLGGVAWPNSGDEYSYVFQADTFAAGRLWDPAPPDPVLFESFRVQVKDGRTFSPYPPAWSAYLVPFRTLGAVWLANPVLTVLLGVALAGACCRLKLSPVVRKPALVLVLLTPFALFLGGSVFPQTMTGALVVGLVWAQLVDEASPRRWRKLLIGGLFGVLLLTRYDVFAVVALLYAVDRLVLRRLGAVSDGLIVMLGLLPFVMCLAAYNAGVTGNPLQLTATWVGPGALDRLGSEVGTGPLMLSAYTNLYWAGSLAQFGGLPVAVLAAIALAVKIRQRTCRFYDFVFPAAVLFYLFVPFTGGHQYGPRYWFWGWLLAILTIGSGLVDQAGQLHLAGRRVSFEGFAAACVVYAAASFCILLVTSHAYIGARREVFGGQQPQSRAIVLLPTRNLWIWPWQSQGILTRSQDFTRNDIDYNARVLYGSDDVPDAVQRACRLEGREVFRWGAPGRLTPVACP
jgi:hypothetical protein